MAVGEIRPGQYDTESPLGEAIQQIVGSFPPFPEINGVYSEQEMGEYRLVVVPGAGALDLAEWCGWEVAESAAAWATGSGIVEAAELMVQRAVENDNIPPRVSS